MTLIEELQHVVSVWDKTPEGTRLVVMDKGQGLLLLKALMNKMKAFESEDWKKASYGDTFEEYFDRITQGWTFDYAFIARYEGEGPLPRVMALVSRQRASEADWLYLTGGIGPDPMCGGEVLDKIGRPRGLVRALLYEVGIRTIRMYCGDQTPALRGATAAQYTLEQHTDGRLAGTLELKREDYGPRQASVIFVGTDRGGADVRREDGPRPEERPA